MRFKKSAKRMVGLLPCDKFGTKAERKQPEYIAALHIAMQEALSLVVYQLRDADLRIDVKIDKRSRRVAVRIVWWVADYQEASMLSGCVGAWNTAQPCIHCHIPQAQQAQARAGLPRTEDVIKPLVRQALQNDDAGDLQAQVEEMSCRLLNLALWDMPSFHVYHALPPDLMHMVPEGVFKHLAKTLFASMSTADRGVLDKRLEEQAKESTILPPLPPDCTALPDLDATKLMAILQLLPLCLLGLASVSTEAMQLVLEFHAWVERARAPSFSEADLDALESTGKGWAAQFVQLFGDELGSGGNFPKLHVLFAHLCEFIREFGAPAGYDSGSFEAYHKYAIKRPYRRSNARDAATFLATINRREALVKRLRQATAVPTPAPPGDRPDRTLQGEGT